jgi:hypothetical protein
MLWTCPFCDRNATIAGDDMRAVIGNLSIKSVHGYRKLRATFIVCPNPHCREFSLDVVLFALDISFGTEIQGEPTNQWRLIPSSTAKVFPSYVPQHILQNYEEACRIVDGSPKASATLSRRCLQGMIRDFWNVNKPNLKQEIDELNGRVDEETWKAIDAIRTIGNIGAHMEKDVNIIVDVEPGEAEKLIWLIELLLKDWYVRRHEREKRLLEIALIGAEKEKARKQQD